MKKELNRLLKRQKEIEAEKESIEEQIKIEINKTKKKEVLIDPTYLADYSGSIDNMIRLLNNLKLEGYTRISVDAGHNNVEFIPERD